jgi:hypothetical protein
MQFGSADALLLVHILKLGHFSQSSEAKPVVKDPPASNSVFLAKCALVLVVREMIVCWLVRCDFNQFRPQAPLIFRRLHVVDARGQSLFCM